MCQMLYAGRWLLPFVGLVWHLDDPRQGRPLGEGSCRRRRSCRYLAALKCVWGPGGRIAPDHPPPSLRRRCWEDTLFPLYGARRLCALAGRRTRGGWR
ncbi:hypothetical protein C8T65DRAFT_633858 [Cerioporus squamosus]|nr:hypothetical protein C8T65DRAFT_633858 [Cerioporus squamosus]